MMEFCVNVAEVKEFIKGITETPGRFFNMIRYSVRDNVGRYLSELMEGVEISFRIAGGDWMALRFN